MNNQDPHSQIENDETTKAEYSNERDLEDAKINKTSAVPNFMSKILSYVKIKEVINS